MYVKPDTITTTFVKYHFDVSKPREARAYEELCARLEGRKPMCTFEMRDRGNRTFYEWLDALPEVGPVTLDTTCVFGNQWNTCDGYRIMDWHEGVYPNNNVRGGYYIEITEEIRALRDNVLTCGYCGEQYLRGSVQGAAFCSKCLGSPYLKIERLSQLKLVSVAEGDAKRTMTDAERESIEAAYVRAQMTRKKVETESLRSAFEAERKLAIEVANEKVDGFLWLLDRGLSTENVIYYEHTRTFCFGWHGSGLSSAVADRWTLALQTFPYAHEIRVA